MSCKQDLPKKVKAQKAIKELLEGKDVTVGSFKEADEVLYGAFPNAKKVTGAGPRDPARTSRLKKSFKRTDEGIFHKDYQFNKDGVLYGHEELPDLHPHKYNPHINVMTPEGKKVTIFIQK